MDKIYYQPQQHALVPAVRPAAATTTTTTTDWRQQLPVLCGTKVILRELEIEDAPVLFALLTTDEVSRFISPPPTTVEGFEKFILWARRERELGRYACFAVVPHGMNTAVGLFQIRQLEANFVTGEWGFALGADFWGTGMFKDSAQMVVDFAVETLGVRRLEARAAVMNGRGNGALRKIGAVQEGVLRKSFTKNGQQYDQMLWSILAEEWIQAKAVWGPGLVH